MNIVIIAEEEIRIFDRPSAATSLLLIEEVKKLQSRMNQALEKVDETDKDSLYFHWDTQDA
jgi:hypothetical protein